MPDHETLSSDPKLPLTDLPLIKPAAPTPPEFDPNGFSWLKYLRGGANVLEAWNERLYSQDIFLAPAGNMQFYYLNHPKLISDVLKDTKGLFARSDIQQSTVGPVLGNGLLSVDGEEWRQQRKIMAPVFQPRQVSAFEDEMRASTKRTVDAWRAKPPKRAFDIIPSTSKLTLDFIANALFGGLSEDEHDKLSGDTESSLQKMPMLSAGLLLNPFKSINPKISAFTFRKQISMLDELAEGFVQRYREEQSQGVDTLSSTLLGRLIEATENETNELIDTKFVRDQVATFLLAGHETTGKALAWTLYVLSIDEARRDKLMVSLAEEGESSTYLEYVIKESLRLYPPAFTISRDVTEDMTIADRDVKAGSTIMISPWLVQRNPDLWIEADKFWPERWEKEELKGDRRYAWLPFGAGPRVCIGGALAMSELKIMLHGLLTAFRFDLSDVQKVAPKGMVTLGASNGIWMKVKELSAD